MYIYSDTRKVFKKIKENIKKIRENINWAEKFYNQV